METEYLTYMYGNNEDIIRDCERKKMFKIKDCVTKKYDEFWIYFGNNPTWLESNIRVAIWRDR